jgi:hypothetical protein
MVTTPYDDPGHPSGQWTVELTWLGMTGHEDVENVLVGVDFLASEIAEKLQIGDELIFFQAPSQKRARMTISSTPASMNPREAHEDEEANVRRGQMAVLSQESAQGVQERKDLLLEMRSLLRRMADDCMALYVNAHDLLARLKGNPSLVTQANADVLGIDRESLVAIEERLHRLKLELK